MSEPSYSPLERIIKVYPQYVLPHHLLSQFMYLLMRCRIPVVKNTLIKTIIDEYDVDMSCALEPDIKKYEHFNSFFTRQLKPESRPIDSASNSIISPVDGKVSQAQKIENGRIFQAKGQSYTATELLGGSEQRAAPFLNGDFATIYLSPRDYHRIHSPIDGDLVEMVHVPGRLFSVNPITTENVPRLFARNERVVSIFQTPVGLVAVVLVGAIFVSSMDTVWAGTITPPYATKVRAWKYKKEDPIHLNKGDELGRFNMGSTVILLFEPNRVQMENNLQPKQVLRMGEKIATAI